MATGEQGWRAQARWETARTGVRIRHDYTTVVARHESLYKKLGTCAVGCKTCLMPLPASLKAGFREAARFSRAAMLFRWLDSRSDVVRVLLYHRIADSSDLHSGDPNLISAAPAEFAAQMGYLARRYRPIGAQTLLEAIHEGKLLPSRAVLVTFDDGYRDFLTHAWAVLQHYRIPAVMFVPTAFPDSRLTFWWDAIHDLMTRTRRQTVTLPDGMRLALRTDMDRRTAARQLNRRLRGLRPEAIETELYYLRDVCGVPYLDPAPVLDWDELRHLSRSGLAVASHTRTHSAIAALRREEIAAEIMGSQADLRRELGEVVPLFSFPHGTADPRADDLLRAAGVVAAFTAAPGRNLRGRAELLRFRRQSVNSSRSFADFSLSLISFYSLFQERSAFGRGESLSTHS